MLVITLKDLLCLGSVTFDGTLTQLHADKHQQTAKMENTGQVLRELVTITYKWVKSKF